MCKKSKIKSVHKKIGGCPYNRIRKGDSDQHHWCQHNYYEPGGQIRQPPGDQGFRHVRLNKDEHPAPVENKKH